jgi:crescentin
MVSAWSFIWKRLAADGAEPARTAPRPEWPVEEARAAEPAPVAVTSPRLIDIPRDNGPLDSIGQRNELLRVRFSQLAHRLDDLKSLNDDFALLAEPLEAIFTELPQAKSRILETEALLSRELENGQAVRREVDTLSGRLSAVSSELRNERARSQKIESELGELSAVFEETRLTLREKAGLLENAERQLVLEMEKQQSLAADLAVQRAEFQATEKALVKAEATLQRETEQRSIYEKESRRLQQVVEDQLDRAAGLQAQNGDLAQQRDRHLAEIAALDARLQDVQGLHQKTAAENEAVIAQLTTERATMTLRLDALLARLGTTEQILGNVRGQFREKEEALRGAERQLKDGVTERAALDRRLDTARGELAHYMAQLEDSHRQQQELNDRADMLNKALAAKDAALENAVNKSNSLADRIESLTARYENDRLNQEAASRRLIEELENEKAERTLAQGALEIARENRSALQRQNESLKRAVRAGQAHPDDQPTPARPVEDAPPSTSNVSFLTVPDKKND